MSRLIVYYSLSGKSRQVAEWLAAATGADIAPIVEQGRRGFTPMGMVRAGIEALFRRRPPIKAMAKRAAAYDQVILCCPVWMGRLAAPGRTWLAGEREVLRWFALSLQSGSDLIAGALGEAEVMIGRPPDATLSVTEIDFGNQVAEGKVAAFARQLTPIEAARP